VRLFGKPLHRSRHAVKEECLRLVPATVPAGRSNQLLGLGNGKGSEEVGENALQ
jgi:hypothetical protein